MNDPMVKPSVYSLTALILAGGQSSRMNGQDKGLVHLHNKTLISHVLEPFNNKVSNIVISANRNQEIYERYAPVFSDLPELGKWQGPLAGLASAKDKVPSEWVITASCDVPFLPYDYVEMMCRQLNLAGSASLLAVARTTRIQATCMLLHKNLLNDIYNYVVQGGRRVTEWQEKHNPVYVEFDDTGFVNLNSPDDLAKYIR